MKRIQKILAVDDTPENLRLLEAILGPRGYQLVTAESGTTGLAAVHREQPDLVLLDIVMPDLNGYDVCRRLRDDPATRFLPIVMITASGDQERVQALEAGADDFIAKPFNQLELLARVRSLLRLKEYYDTIKQQSSELAEWNRTHYEPEALLQIAMNVEAQAINVPTGLQDYRPAMYGGIAALDLDVDGIRRVPLNVDAAELERRIVLCYTGEPRNSGTNNWDILKKHIDGDQYIFDCFERIRDTAATMREALTRGDWDEVGRAIAMEWDNRKRLAPGVTTPAIDSLIARASTAGATAAKVCGAGGGGCLFCYGPPERRDAIRDALTAGGARVLDFRIERHGLTRG